MKAKDAERIINELINPNPDLEHIKEINEIGEKLSHIMDEKTSKEWRLTEGSLSWKLESERTRRYHKALESAEEEIEQLKKELQKRG